MKKKIYLQNHYQKVPKERAGFVFLLKKIIYQVWLQIMCKSNFHILSYSFLRRNEENRKGLVGQSKVTIA